MASASLWGEEPKRWTVAEYLGAAFEPDCDFVDGLIEERHVGEYEHGKVQSRLDRLLGNREAEWGIDVAVETRLQVAAHRFRVPDVMVLRAGEPVQRIVRVAPLICIEVLSPEDTWRRLNGVLRDYLAMGVAQIWAFDPEERLAYRFDADGLHPVADEVLAVEGTSIRIRVDEVFPPPAV